MIFMGDLLEVLDKFVKYHINVCIIVGGVFGIVVPLNV